MSEKIIKEQFQFIKNCFLFALYIMNLSILSVIEKQITD